MRDPQRRLEWLEYENLRRMAAKAGESFGYSADQVLDEARRVLALPEDEQRQALRRPYLTFRTLFRNSETILPASLQGEKTELAADAFIAHNPLCL